MVLLFVAKPGTRLAVVVAVPVVARADGADTALARAEAEPIAGFLAAVAVDEVAVVGLDSGALAAVVAVV